jgi:hypothetical protein
MEVLKFEMFRNYGVIYVRFYVAGPLKGLLGIVA